MDLEQKRYVFIKPYTTHCGTIPENSELTLFRGFYHINGGRVLQAYNKYIDALLNDVSLKREYLKEVPIIFNKV